mmetsp:Transcript_25565/g.49772  ORF Transcript_25565/g.49772 Transcript_25565/m.49772 type:complete len:105 (-) Transcript_25565:429-743(-)
MSDSGEPGRSKDHSIAIAGYRSKPLFGKRLNENLAVEGSSAVLVPFVTRLSIKSPRDGPNLNPCPENPAATTRRGSLGCVSTMKSWSGVEVYKQWTVVCGFVSR